MVVSLSISFQNYGAYGLTLASNLPLEPWLQISNQPASLVIEGFHGSVDLPVPKIPPLFTHPRLDERGQPLYQLYQLGEILYLRHSSAGGFFIGQHKISAQVPFETDLAIVCTVLLSSVLSLWLELRSIRCLHACALVYQGKAAAFMADSMAGKSTLAATLLQMGAELLSDDIVPIVETPQGFLANPGYPSIRLSKDQVDYFLGGQARLARWYPALKKALIPIGTAGWRSFCDKVQKIQCLYILQRVPNSCNSEVHFEALTKADSVLALIRYSFTRRSSLALGTMAGRMAFFSRLVDQVGVTRLTYPSGYEHLPQISRLIFQNMHTESP